MNIFINDLPVVTPNDNMTVADLVKWKDIPAQGTAIAINDHLIKQDQWPVKQINEFDRITVISAAFGG